MKINFFGSTEGVTGYGTHSRELIKALREKGVTTYQEDDVGTPCLAITMPDTWQVRSGNRHKPFIPFLVFEGTRLSKGWTRICNEDYITELLVPSNHVKEVAEKSGVGKKITVAHHGINTKMFNPQVKREKKIPVDDKFKFLMLGGWGQGVVDRKGFQYALKAFAEEFSAREPVELYWKINMVYNPGLNINNEINKLNLSPDRPLVKIMPQPLPYYELPGLYKAMDCFVAPYMADAYNIPCLESMACGVPVIATNYSGPTDYINNDNGWLINVERMIKSQGTPLNVYEEAKWAEPSIPHLRKLMREAYNNKDLVKKKGLKAAETASKLTWNDTADIVIKRFIKHVKV